MCAERARGARARGGGRKADHTFYVNLPYYLTLSLNLTPWLRRRVRRGFFKAPMERM